MTADEFSAKLKEAINTLEGGNRNLMLQLGQTALRSIKNRVIEGGKNERYTDYSSIKPYTPTYAKLRAKKGKPQGRVTFSLTGLMWKDIKVNPEKTLYNETVIEPTSEGYKEILGYLVEKRGEILVLSTDEIRNLDNIVIKRAEDVLKKAGL